MKSLLNTMLILMLFWPLLSSGSGPVGTYNTGFSADYEIGKKIFQTRVICETCAYPDLAIPEGIAEIVPDLEREGAIGKFLSIKELSSVKLFLKKQFDIEI